MTDGSIGSILATVDDWGASFAAVTVMSDGSVVASHGDTSRVVRIASITKLVTAWATLLAVEEGAVGLDDPLGPPGSSVRHILCHASGLSFDSDIVLTPPATRRIYSQRGYELLGEHIATVTGIPFAAYVAEAVLQPLDMAASELRGDAGAHLWSNVNDLVSFVGEVRQPTLIHTDTATTFRTSQFPDLVGVLPGWGRQSPCSWGFGPEIRATKEPHWSGSSAPPSTYGHFGGSGTFVWIDPVADVACIALTDREFGDWAVGAWPPFSDAVRAALIR